MTSSASSSSRSRLLRAAPLALLAAAALAGCRGAQPLADPPPVPKVGPRLALFPLSNRSGGAAPTKAVAAAFREKLLARHLDLAPDEEVLRVLQDRRVRFTGGIDRETAKALREEAGVEGVIIADLEVYGLQAPYRFALTARLTTTAGDPTIRWLDAVARGSADSPGLLGLHLIPSVEQLRDKVLDEVADSLVRSIRSPRRIEPCPDWGGRAPDREYRSDLANDPARRSIAVLPFLNYTSRRDAGEVAALRLLVPLVASGVLDVLEPGVVRREMLSYRLGAAGGISLDDARVILELLDADLVLSGEVRTFEDAAGSFGAPNVDFSVWVLDRRTGQLVWSSTASANGDDGVWFFGLGKVTTASALACTIAKESTKRMLEDRKPLPPATPAGSPPPPPPPTPDAAGAPAPAATPAESQIPAPNPAPGPVPAAPPNPVPTPPPAPPPEAVPAPVVPPPPPSDAGFAPPRG